MSVFKKISRKIKRFIKKEKDYREELLNLMPKNSICAEVGVWKGGFSKRIIKHVLPTELHLIDPWKYQTGFGKRWYGGLAAKSQEDMDGIYQQVVREFSTKSCIRIHREFSNKAFSTFEDEYFDRVYIDGNHYYEYVLEDLRNFALKIKNGGLLTGDDYLWTSTELNGDKPVFRAVNDFLKENKCFTLLSILGDQFILKKCI